jgi:hypothetical protein
MEQSATIVFGSPEFWSFYDEFCGGKSISKLNYQREYPLAVKMHEITYAAHSSRAIHELKRPERGWEHHHAWLALRTLEIPRQDNGAPSGLVIRAGDIIVVEHQWDRDVIITHTPIPRNIISGYLLSGRYESMIGLFLPLFDRETIMRSINIRLGQNVEEGYQLAQEEARDWNWY